MQPRPVPSRGKCRGNINGGETNSLRLANRAIRLRYKRKEKKMTGQFELLMKDIEDAIDQSQAGGNGWWISDGVLIVETQTSRDPSRSSNGGEYFFYREFNPGLGVTARDEWSADWDIMQYGGVINEYDCVVGIDGLRRMAQLAEVTLAAKAWLSKSPGSMRQLKKAIRALDN